MSLIVKQQNSNYQPAPAGNHVAICYMVVDMGDQPSTFDYQTTYKRKVKIGWELSNTKMEDGRPYSVSKNYTLSLRDSSNLYKDLISWRGRDFNNQELQAFNLFSILEAPCNLNIVHKPSADGKRTYANIMSVTPIMQGQTILPRINPILKFSIDHFDQGEFNSLPDGIKNKINIPHELRFGSVQQQPNQYQQRQPMATQQPYMPQFGESVSREGIGQTVGSSGDWRPIEAPQADSPPNLYADQYSAPRQPVEQRQPTAQPQAPQSGEMPFDDDIPF